MYIFKAVVAASFFSQHALAGTDSGCNVNTTFVTDVGDVWLNRHSKLQHVVPASRLLCSLPNSDSACNSCTDRKLHHHRWPSSPRYHSSVARATILMDPTISSTTVRPGCNIRGCHTDVAALFHHRLVIRSEAS